MKNNMFKKSMLALSIPVAIMSAAVSAAPTFEQAKLVQVKETGINSTSFIVKFKGSSANDDSVITGSLQAESLALDSTASKKAQDFISSMARDFTTVSGLDFSHARPMALANHHVFNVSDKLSPKQIQRVIELLSRNSNVEYVEENKLMQAFATPNDPSYTDMWHYFENTGGLNVPGAWDTVTGSGVTVAVLDTGYRPHADLAGNIVGGYDMISNSFIANDGGGRDSDARDTGDALTRGECGTDSLGRPVPSSATNSSWHGTHVAGTVAALGNNNRDIAGVAYGAKVVPVRVLGKCGGTTADIADAIVWASGGSVSGVPSNANPADVINMSLGGEGSCSSTTQSAINSARSRGSVIVVAAGNDNDNVSKYNPGNCSGVVTVAATNRQGGRAYYSNYGSLIDVAAPGGAQSFANDPEGILSTHNSGTTGPGSDKLTYMQGTSMAAPHVAGVAALIKEAKPSATPDEIETILKNTARSFPGSCSSCGTGIVDASAAVASASGGDNGGGTPPDGGATGGGGSVDNISASRRNWKRYTLNVPANMSQLEVTTSGGSGDADLYVRFNATPSTSSYDCRSWKSGNNETCTFNNPQAGDWKIGLYAYSSFSGVKLEAYYKP